MTLYDSSNIFARIIRGEIPSDKIYEDNSVLAIRDIAQAAPTHVLVMPKGDYVSFDDFCARADEMTIAYFFKTVRAVAAKLGVADAGYRLITNHGAHAEQSVAHFHVHILAGRPLGKILA